MNSNISRRQPFQYTRGGSTPFHSHGYRPQAAHNNHHHNHNNHNNDRNRRPYHRGGWPAGKTHSSYSGHHYDRGHHHPPRASHNSPRMAPTNHNWEKEHAAANVCQDYESIGTVMWVDDIYGEVLCEKNLHHSRAHFFFDGSTEIGGQTVASAARSEEGLKLEPGTKIEFCCKYTPADDKVPHLVRILKMAIYGASPKKELEQLCMTSYSSDPHKPKLAIDSSGDFVLISPVLFSKEWALKSINSTMIGSVPDYQEPDRGKFIAGRTFLGTIIKAPRWMLDGGVRGDAGNNVRKLLLGIEHMNPLIDGQATILHVVPFQSALLEADDRPGETMYFPIVSFPPTFKQQIVQGNRVHFAACRNLDAFSYPWRVIEIAFLKYGSPYHYRMPANRPMYCVNPENRHVPQAEETLVAVDSTETALEDEKKETPPEEAKKDVWKDIFGVSEGTPVALCQDELEEYLKEKAETAETLSVPTPPIAAPLPKEDDSPSSASCSDVSISLESLAQAEPAPIQNGPEYMIFSEPRPDPDVVREVLGYGSNDTEPAVRCLARHKKKRDYNHLVMTIPERLAEEQRKREEERREAEEACRLKRPREREMRLKLQEEFARIRGDKPVEKRIEKVEKEEKREKAGPVVANYEAPVDGMQIVGLYDDVRWVFELSLVETEEKKRRENARQEAEKLKKQKGDQEDDATSEPVELPGRPTDGFWYRRRTPRPLPAFYVAELLSNRTEKEICQEYDVRSLTRAVVLRNPRTRPLEEASQVEEEDVVTAKETEEDREEETKENVEEKEEEAKPAPFKSKLLDDQIIANFIQPLLKKQIF